MNKYDYFTIVSDYAGDKFLERMQTKIRLRPIIAKPLLDRLFLHEYYQIKLDSADTINGISYDQLLQTDLENYCNMIQKKGSYYIYYFNFDVQTSEGIKTVQSASYVYVGYDETEQEYFIDVVATDKDRIRNGSHIVRNFYRSKTLEMLSMFMKQTFTYDSELYISILSNKNIDLYHYYQMIEEAIMSLRKRFGGKSADEVVTSMLDEITGEEDDDY